MWAAAFPCTLRRQRSRERTFAGGSWIIAACAVIVGALTGWLGTIQASLLVGDHHWIIQVIHLLLGLLTIGLGHIGAARYRRSYAQ